ncbi:MAG: hypothetical protein IT324_33100 [Anaerolineae bacterium]|nr:hypothetical protein [Anaerolineae bacterium]
MRQFKRAFGLCCIVAFISLFVIVPLSNYNAPVAQAQGQKPATCPDLVRKALQTVSGKCTNTGRNQVCYGNTALSAEAQEGTGAIKFAAPGDITDLKNIRSIKLSGLDTASQQWGIALLRAQANLPDTVRGQNVTMLLFGDVDIMEASQTTTSSAQTAVLSTQTAFAPTINAADTLRAPTQQSFNTAIAGTQQYLSTMRYSTIDARSTFQNATALAQGTNQNGTAQSRIASQNPTQQFRSTIQSGTQIARSTALDATVQARSSAQFQTRSAQETSQAATFFARSTTQYSTLIAPLPLPVYKPMQAFYFRSGIGEAACAEAPRNGILVQSPQGKQTIKLSVDEAIIEMGSTVFMTAQPSGKLAIYTLEGLASVSAFGVTQQAPAGMVVRVPLDSNLRASGPPEPPVPYDLRDVQALPIRNIPVPIRIASPRAAVSAASLISTELGEICGKGSVTVGNSTSLPRNFYTVAVPVGGGWSVKAGTTITVSVTGSLLVQSVWKNYIALAPAGAGLAGPVEASAFAVSGGATKLTYTFTKDNPRFFIDVGITVPGGVTATVTCVSAATPVSSLTPTVTSSPTRTPGSAAMNDAVDMVGIINPDKQ